VTAFYFADDIFLEQPGHPALQFPTRCVHNLAIDPMDENYIASCFPGADATICIWDRRSSSRSLSSGGLANLNNSESNQLGAALEFRNVVDTANTIVPGTIWSLRFSRSKRGCLGVLSSTGQFKVYDIVKSYVSEEDRSALDRTLGDGSAEKYPEKIYTKGIRDVHSAFPHPSRGRREDQRIVSFDWMGIAGKPTKPLAVSLCADSKIRVLELAHPPPRFAFSSRADLVKERRSSKSDLDPLNLSPSIKSQQTIPGTIRAVRRTVQSAKGMKGSSVQTNGDQQEVWFDRESYSSRRRHEHLLFMGKVRFSLEPQDVLTLMTTSRRRCEEGYRLDCYKNKDIVSEDPWLQDMWSWIGSKLH
jgi:WD repeat-containing protein mio